MEHLRIVSPTPYETSLDHIRSYDILPKRKRCLLSYIDVKYRQIERQIQRQGHKKFKEGLNTHGSHAIFTEIGGFKDINILTSQPVNFLLVNQTRQNQIQKRKTSFLAELIL